MSYKREPIAITGMACRFPGGCRTPEQFWELLCRHAEVISEIDAGRWSAEFYHHPDRDAPGRTYSKSAGLLDDVYHFDPGFFGISPREAMQMDPQQRLLLEMTWEALEDAGIPAGRLAGTDCSVFVGISSTDYANSRFDDPAVADGYFMTGNTLSIAANRISYLFDLHGPSMAIDTACSSSLVALHQACSALWSGQSQTSIVGSAHLLLSPFPFIGFSKASMLSETGECRVFDADANGYVRSEGGAVLFLKPLSRARADGDPVHAVILGSGVNTDGRKSALTVPNGRAQQRLLEQVYADCGIAVEDVDYIEAHGTGTPVGDPIEADAIGTVIGRRRAADKPLLIGSVKANIGHLEPASGMAGLVKTVLALKHRAVPGAVRFRRPSPAIDFTGLNIRVVEEYTPLETAGRELIMGVNSFGFGGSNAHVILGGSADEAAPAPAAAVREWPPLYLSARSENSLKERARQFQHLLEQNPPAEDGYDLCYTAALHREPLSHGLVVWGGDAGEIRDQLRRFCAGDVTANLVSGEHGARPGKVAFVYSGNNSQWAGMGRDLLEVPVFREQVRAVDRSFLPLAGWSIEKTLAEGGDDGPRLELTEIAQPLLFAVQVGITAMLRERGIEPDGVTGHSVGEIAAAWAAGILDLDAAVQVIYYRSHLQAGTRGKGRMIAANISPADAEGIIAGMNAPLELAAINSPRSTTLTGSALVIERAARKLQELKIRCRLLDIDYPFHSTAMDAVRDRFTEIMPPLPHRDGPVGFYSAVHGGRLDGSALDREYWWDNIRRPVRFGPAVAALIADDHDLFIEIGPHPVLQSYLRECLYDSPRPDGKVVTTLRKSRDGADCMRRAVFAACLHQGLPPRAFFPRPGRRVPLPAYPWDRRPYQFQGTNEAVNRRRDHVLLGFHLNNVDGLWENRIDTATHPFLADHVVDDTIVMPAAAFAEMALAASKQCFDRSHHEIANLEIRRPLILDSAETRSVQFSLNTDDLNFTIKSKPRLSDQPWKTHVVGRLINAASDYATPRVNVGEIKQRSRYGVDGAEIYDTAALLGLQYGPAFRAVRNVWVGEDELLSHIVLPEDTARQAAGFVVHPAWMDAAFHTLFPAFAERRDRSFETHASPYLPVAIGDLRFHKSLNGSGYCLCRINSAGKEIINATFILLDEAGRPLVELKQCVFRRYARRNARKKLPVCLGYEQIPADRPQGGDASPLCGIDLAPVAGQLDDVPAVIAARREDPSLARLHHDLAAALALDALYQLGAHLEEFTVDSLMASAGIAAAHRHYFTWILQFLQDAGHAENDHGSWKIAAGENGAAEKWGSILRNYPHHLDDMILAATRGFSLVRALTGSDPDQDQDQPDRRKGINWYLRRYNAGRLSNELVRAAVRHVMDHWPRDSRRLRIADIGTGSSSLTRALVAMLPPQWCDLTLLIEDEEEAALARREFAADVHVRVVCGGPGGGEETDVYDVVLVSRYLYEFNDNPDILADVASRVRPGGMVLAADRKPDPLCDVLFGIEPGWWSRTLDADRPVSSLLEPGQWLKKFHRSGLEDAALLGGADLVNARESVFTARLPATGESMTEPGLHDASLIIISDWEGDSYRIAEHLRQSLADAGNRVLWAVDSAATAARDGIRHVNLESGDGFDALAAALRESGGSCDGIVYLPGVRLRGTDKDGDVLEGQQRGCMGMVHLARRFETLLASPPRIWFVTAASVFDAGTRAPGMPVPLPRQAAQWGFVRVLRNEYANGVFRLVDLQELTDPRDAAARLLRELAAGDGEDEVLLARESRRVLRLAHLSDPASNSLLQPRGGAAPEAWQLSIHSPGNLRDMKWRQMPRRRPGAGEVEIRVMAAGLNFRDIMYASGLLPDEMLDDGFAGATLGLECAGVITAVGEDVNEFSTGDAVLAFAPACFSSHVIAPLTTVIPKPVNWSYESAATVPTAFFTVFYAVSHLAGLKPGEKILIHGATGGVGLAAIQYAQYCGAEIFATAGSEEKRRFLSLLGIKHILNSRSLEFADEIMSLTGGEGIDVVLNSLAGEAIDKSLSVLRPGGRFLELGKRDYFENTRIGLRPFRHNIAYFGVDADQLIRRQPELSRSLFREVMNLFTHGVFTPLPQTVFSADGAVDAFRLMQQSQHIGKVIVSLRRPPCHIDVPLTGTRFELRSDASYLVSGGLSGFGLATARWLVDKGAQHLVLISRSGVPAEADAPLLAALEERGVEVLAMACDVADPVSLQRVLREARDRLPPIRGVVHSAMVLDDHLIRDLDMGSLEAAMKPKIQGAWNLHQLTRELDFFVLYSSVTACLGNPGQANYVAGNQYLEALAEYRRGRGLPATVVAWDAIMDSGYLARNTALRESLSKRHGINGVNSEQALRTLERLLETGRTHAVVLNPNWQRLARSLGRSSKFRWLLHNLPQEAAAGDEQGILEALEGLEPAAQRQRLADLIAAKVADILKISGGKLQFNQPLHDIGIDSLMAMELATAIENHFGVEIPLMSLADNATIDSLSRHLHEALIPQLCEGLQQGPAETVVPMQEKSPSTLPSSSPATPDPPRKIPKSS